MVLFQVRLNILRDLIWILSELWVLVLVESLVLLYALSQCLIIHLVVTVVLTLVLSMIFTIYLDHMVVSHHFILTFPIHHFIQLVEGLVLKVTRIEMRRDLTFVGEWILGFQSCHFMGLCQLHFLVPRQLFEPNAPSVFLRRLSTIICHHI